MSFRNEIFKLCKELQKKDEKIDITKLIYELNVWVERNDDGSSTNFSPNRTDYGYVSKHSMNQFYGYLYTNENIESYKEMFPSMKSLEEEEIKLIEQTVK